MAVLNLRDVPDDLAHALRVEAAQAAMGIKDYCVAIFESRKKIADDLAGVVGENPACAPMGKRGLGESEAELSDEGMEILYGRTGDTSNFGAIVVPVQKKIAGKKHVPGVAVRLEKTSGGSTTLMAAKVPEATMNTLRDICAGKINNVLITPTMGADGNFVEICPVCGGRGLVAGCPECGVIQESFIAGAKPCSLCGEEMVAAKGKWACGDQSCGMYGREQGRVE